MRSPTTTSALLRVDGHSSQAGLSGAASCLAGLGSVFRTACGLSGRAAPTVASGCEAMHCSDLGVSRRPIYFRWFADSRRRRTFGFSFGLYVVLLFWPTFET